MYNLTLDAMSYPFDFYFSNSPKKRYYLYLVFSCFWILKNNIHRFSGSIHQEFKETLIQYNNTFCTNFFSIQALHLKFSFLNWHFSKNWHFPNFFKFLFVHSETSLERVSYGYWISFVVVLVSHCINLILDRHVRQFDLRHV